MPANLTPDYQRADQRYREATTPAEKLAALEEMLRTLPKHKGTEKMQADLKRKISEARESMAAARKSGGGRDPFHLPRQGAGQVLLIGAPNVGKSALVGAMTAAPVKVADFPFSTHEPVPGMAHYEDVPIQLVDTPPVTREHAAAGFWGAVHNADLVAPVVNVGADSLIEDAETVLDLLRERRMRLVSAPVLPPVEPDSPLPKRGLLIANGVDLPGAGDNLDLLRDLAGGELKVVGVSAVSGENLDELLKAFFDLLHVVRVYAKPPGKPPDKSAPFLLPVGSTVLDLAGRIHKDVAARFKHARVWGDGVFPGQQVHHDHVLHDKDVIEIHV
ncbi:MAG: TGS domain-containing protein [Phycisphaerae bacterium]|jgi:hypothetical protein